MKKLLSIALTLAMVMALTVPAVAAETHAPYVQPIMGYRYDETVGDSVLTQVGSLSFSAATVETKTFSVTAPWDDYEAEVTVITVQPGAVMTVTGEGLEADSFCVLEGNTLEIPMSFMEYLKSDVFEFDGTLTTGPVDSAFDQFAVPVCLVLTSDTENMVILALGGSAAPVEAPVETPAEETKPAPSAWAAAEVESARELGLVPALTGDPVYTDQMTREQFAELVAQLLKTACPEVADSAGDVAFDDCDNPAVLLVSSLGVVNGVGNGQFAPAQTTNREQIATMLARAIDVVEAATGVDLTPAPASIEAFADKDQVSDWAVEGVGTLAANSIMNGTSDTTLSPKGSCSVEQSICLIYRVYEAIQALI